MALTFTAASSMRVSLGTAINLLQNVPGATVMAWVKPATLGSGGVISASVNAGGDTSRVEIELIGGAYSVVGRRTDAEAGTSATGGTPAIGTIAHVCGVLRFSTGGIDLYINGVLVTTTNNAGWTGNSANTTCGIAHLGSEDTGASNYFDGTMDDARIYNRALSASEINTIYRARGADGIVLSLADRWTFNEQSAGVAATGAGTVRDKCNLLPGTPTNSPVYAGEIAIYRRRRRAA